MNTTSITLTDLHVENDLQQEIIDDLTDCGLDADEQITALRDQANTPDPVYQFIGMMYTEAHIEREYNRLKAGIVDQLNALQDGGLDVRDSLRRDAFDRDTTHHTPDHNDWCFACLRLALWGAAGDLHNQVEAAEYN